ncbi:helix-turn-helix DNA-binding domain protein [Arthrobacter phage Qui]|uniref:Helix-turn-helix DNA binding domain protein n=1 Tax=Arthrobacter phage Qui TaxID=2603260 RepID=A0A5B8WKC9_9CAUD|nr:helix-turn-helix DNA-binding domain protein [Arthrobacter phage Qui]QED11565.1 helix-turn-helix DNA-binding domain protein [Arthrobacter phage Qui]QOC56397.1 helix-turn-helix DNA-binding domain protein [Arthrobacter phage Paella]
MSEKTDKIKKHFSDNKKLYIGIGIGVAVTVTAVVIFPDKGIQIVDAFKLQVNSPTTNNVIQANLARRGHPGNIVRCVTTGEVFASQKRAAEANGLSVSSLIRHLNGERPDVKGLTFELLGEMS